MATKRATAAVKEDKDSRIASVNKMCRLCLKTGTNENLMDIFDASAETSLTIRIMACAGLEAINNLECFFHSSLIEVYLIFAGVVTRCVAEKNLLGLSVAIGEIVFVPPQKQEFRCKTAPSLPID